MKWMYKAGIVTCVFMVSISWLNHLSPNTGMRESELEVQYSATPEWTVNASDIADPKNFLSEDVEQTSVQLMNPRFYKRLNQKINALLSSSSL